MMTDKPQTEEMEAPAEGGDEPSVGMKLPLPEGSDLKAGDRFSGQVEGSVVDEGGTLMVAVESLDGKPVAAPAGEAPKDGTEEIESELTRKLQERQAAQSPEMDEEE